jgi:hypothetical protein
MTTMMKLIIESENIDKKMYFCITDNDEKKAMLCYKNYNQQQSSRSDIQT